MIHINTIEHLGYIEA